MEVEAFDEQLREGYESERLWAQKIADLVVDPQEVSLTGDELQSVFDEWPFELNGPFVGLVSSVLGTASAVRGANGFADLTRDQIVVT
ncbi:MAG: hypothetical protein GEU79_03285 [Acidimicrobiia bacterium]|nr:hypothetical protein [Acidimicrobiia bacterium]